MGDYSRSDWVTQVKKSEIPLWKNGIYSIFRSYWNSRVSNVVSPISIAENINAKLISERGYPVSYRRSWASQGFNLKNLTILVQGTGNGWDVVSWAKLKPKLIVAVDLFEFQEWFEISEFCQKKYGVKVEFVSSPLEIDFGLKSDSVDLVVSDAVYEHCTNLASVLTETRRVLKDNGRVYANYGPLWYCAGGDHFSGRDDLKSSYNHLLLDKPSYQVYVSENRSSNEDFQSGARYIELNLFSKLTTQGYLRVYEDMGFKVTDLWCEISLRALRFREVYPKVFLSLLENSCRALTADDLLIKAHHLRMSKC